MAEALLTVAICVIVPLAVVVVAVGLSRGWDGGRNHAVATDRRVPPHSHQSDETGSPVLTTTGSGPVDAAVSEPPQLAVWPRGDRGRRYHEPLDVAAGFARDYLGFSHPLIGTYQPIDDLFGRIEVRATEEGPATTVSVHRIGDGSWWVTGATSAHIAVDDPVAGRPIGDPVHVSGRAITTDGQVELQLRAVGEKEPLLRRFFATGGGEEWQWFEGAFGWPESDASYGALLLMIREQDGGAVTEAVVLPVVFGETQRRE